MLVYESEGSCVNIMSLKKFECCIQKMKFIAQDISK